MVIKPNDIVNVPVVVVVMVLLPATRLGVAGAGTVTVAVPPRTGLAVALTPAGSVTKNEPAVVTVTVIVEAVGSFMGRPVAAPRLPAVIVNVPAALAVMTLAPATKPTVAAGPAGAAPTAALVKGPAETVAVEALATIPVGRVIVKVPPALVIVTTVPATISSGPPPVITAVPAVTVPLLSVVLTRATLFAAKADPTVDLKVILSPTLATIVGLKVAVAR